MVILLLLVFLLRLPPLVRAAPPQQGWVIRVGFYENPPKIYTDETGEITGFWPDLLRAIAAEEGWQLEWVPGAWNELLTKLSSGEIDILPDTGWMPQRAEKYAFNRETVLVSWARVYVHPGEQVESILDLRGKRIAALRGSLNLNGPGGLRDLLYHFDVQATIVEMDDYRQVFEAIQSGKVNAGTTNKDFGNLNENRYAVERTPIIFQPSRLLFAFPKDAPLTPILRAAIDRHLAEMKTDKQSIYFL